MVSIYLKQPKLKVNKFEYFIKTKFPYCMPFSCHISTVLQAGFKIGLNCDLNNG
jgi:hypothetical protein